MKKSGFFENAKLLYGAFGITPLMYGSLGLEYLTGESLAADDVDVLINEIYLGERWDEFKSFLSREGYILTDEREHTFLRGGISYSYASLEELSDFANVSPSDITVYKNEGIPFRLLSLEQYLRVYEASSRDGYRINVRKKKDADKIRFIKERLIKISGKKKRS